MQRSQFMPDHVCSPILRYSHGDKAVQCHSGRQHKIGHQLIIVLILTDLGSYFHQGLQNAFRPTVHYPALSRSSHILLHHMHKRIGNSTSHLMGRQSKRHFRIEDREQRIIGIERIFFFGFMARNHGSAIHLRSCGRQGKNSGKRDGVGHRTPGKYQIPGVAVIQQSGGNQLGAINDRSSSYCKQIVHLFLLSESDGLTQGLDGRVGFNSPKLYSEMILQCFFHLVIYTILFHTTTTEGNHHPFVRRYFFTQATDHPASHDQFYRILKNKIIHRLLLYIVICTEFNLIQK